MSDTRPEMNAPELSAEERAEFYRRRRSRNIAMLAFLCVLVVIFYAIAMVKVSSGDPPSRSVTGALAVPTSGVS
ncbi:hypothetical protein ACE7GA_11525 [Roseomonas sp. CCTCC AB2023176]|uniref:hypothetical protein n=1 Tax=Roseomonas sp. CCTCC AB2023176 TaxID=3342640 RepID=UPI0035E19E2C